MKKTFLVGVSVGFIIFLSIGSRLNWFGSNDSGSFPKRPDAPSFTVSTEFDGEWIGRRINTTNNNMCERTTITGTIINGKASLRLTYNGTSLQGWISENGDLTLYAGHRQWDYRFAAKGNKNKIQGKWFLANGPCRGTWFIERNV